MSGRVETEKRWTCPTSGTSPHNLFFGSTADHPWVETRVCANGHKTITPIARPKLFDDLRTIEEAMACAKAER